MSRSGSRPSEWWASTWTSTARRSRDLREADRGDGELRRRVHLRLLFLLVLLARGGALRVPGEEDRPEAAERPRPRRRVRLTALVGELDLEAQAGLQVLRVHQVEEPELERQRAAEPLRAGPRRRPRPGPLAREVAAEHRPA